MATVQSSLTNVGYSLVAWPKTGIKPLTLLFKTENGVSSVEASLKDLFQTRDVAPPQIIPDETAADIKGMASLVFDAKAGINILDWLLNKLNLGKLAANITLNESYEVTLSYKSVKEDKVSLLALDSFISNSDPKRQQFNSFREKLENSELYVINAVVKSNDISVSIAAKNGHNIQADATVKGIVEANQQVSRINGNTIELTYKTNEAKPLIFAFKAQQIIYEKKSFWTNQPARFYIKNQIGPVLLGPENFPTISLQTKELIDL